MIVVITPEGRHIKYPNACALPNQLGTLKVWDMDMKLLATYPRGTWDSYGRFNILGKAS